MYYEKRVITIKYVFFGLICMLFIQSFAYALFSVKPTRKEFVLMQKDKLHGTFEVRLSGDAEGLDIQPKKWFELEENKHVPLKEWVVFEKTHFDFKVKAVFTAKEFKGPYNVKKLCSAIRSDSYSKAVSWLMGKRSLKALNALLKRSGFYREVLRKKKDIELSSVVKKYIKKVKPYKNIRASRLTGKQRRDIMVLNRMLIQELYPQYCPLLRSKERRQMINYTINVPTYTVGELMVMVSFSPRFVAGSEMITQIFSVPLYVFIKGTEERSGNIQNVTLSKEGDTLVCNVSIENTGNVHFRPVGKITFLKRKKKRAEGVLKEGWPAYPRQIRNFESRIPAIKDGKYRMLVDIYYREAEPMQQKLYYVKIKKNKKIKVVEK